MISMSLDYTLCVVRSFQLCEIVRYGFWDMNWHDFWSFMCVTVERSGILAQVSKARLGEKTRNVRMVVHEHLAQMSVSRPSENL